MATASEIQTDNRVAKVIAVKNGISEPKDKLIWKMIDKEIPKEWVKVDNKNFIAHYPQCFKIIAEGENRVTIKNAPSIAFFRTSSCPNYTGQADINNVVSIEYFPSGGVTTLENAYVVDYVVYKQKMRINDLDAVIFAGLLDIYNDKIDVNEPQMRWQIYLSCKKKIFRIAASIPAGQPTLDALNTKNFEFPNDFRQIVTSFRCK